MNEWLALLPGHESFARMMMQGGILTWIIFCVVLVQTYVFLHRWLNWHQIPRNAYGHLSGARLRLQQHADALRNLNELEKGMPLMKALVLITPLLGIGGTVTGMIMVFDGLTLGSAADPRQLSSGIARAILPTFIAMAVVLIGMFLMSLWQRRIRRTLQQDRS